MSIFMKVVCLAKLHIFLLGGLEVFRGILENVPKFYNGTRRAMGTLGFQARVLSMV
jgi:hypothetical protein